MGYSVNVKADHNLEFMQLLVRSGENDRWLNVYSQIKTIQWFYLAGVAGVWMVRLNYVCYVSYVLMVISTPVKRGSNPRVMKAAGRGREKQESSFSLTLFLCSLPLRFLKNKCVFTPAVSTSSFYSNLSSIFFFFYCSTIQNLPPCPLRKY